MGGHAGGAWGDSDKWIPRTPGGAFDGVSLGGHEVDGFIGGVQAGCDYETAGGIVIGVGGDYGWTDASGTHPSTHEAGVFYHSEVRRWRRSPGGSAMPSTIFFSTWKAAPPQERVDYAASTTMIGTAYRASDRRTAGPSAARRRIRSLRPALCLHRICLLRFRHRRIRLTPQYSFLPTAFVDIEDTDNVVRAGVNLRFGPWAR
ncbi:MAG: hypothetical protein R3D01_11990 [Hyphomicrobiales bacterium]